MFREIMKAEFFFYYYHDSGGILQYISKYKIEIHLIIYLFLRGMFLFVLWIINFRVPQIFHIIKNVP